MKFPGSVRCTVYNEISWNGFLRVREPDTVLLQTLLLTLLINLLHLGKNQLKYSRSTQTITIFSVERRVPVNTIGPDHS